MTLNFITDGETLNSSSDSDSTNQSLINEENVSDGSEDDINSYPFVFDESKEIHYKIKYKQIFEEDININEVYILNLDAQKLGQSLRVATAHTDHTCRVYGIEAGSKSFTECLDHEDQIIDVKFGSKDSQISSIVFTGSDNGTIKLWDLRLKEKCISVFKDETDGSPKPITCFDVSCDGRFIVAGTEVLKDDSFLLFWDIRTTNLLGGYWDTHYGDITQVRFHPTEDKTIISGSTDGIINLFDVTQTTEKDALQSSYNTNSSISNLRWLKNKNEDSVISCITHTEDLQLWCTTDSSPFLTIPRDTVSSSMNITPAGYNQVINCHQTDKNGNMMLLVGINYGRGEHLQSLTMTDGPELLPRTVFKNNKQIVRCSWYEKDSGFLVTGGEANILNIWVPSDENNLDTTPNKNSLKILPKISLRNDTSKPY